MSVNHYRVGWCGILPGIAGLDPQIMALQWGRASGARNTIEQAYVDGGYRELQWGRASGARNTWRNFPARCCSGCFNGTVLLEHGIHEEWEARQRGVKASMGPCFRSTEYLIERPKVSKFFKLQWGRASGARNTGVRDWHPFD